MAETMRAEAVGTGYTVRVDGQRFLNPDSALVRTALEMLAAHDSALAADGEPALCARCGAPYPCPTVQHARQVVNAGGVARAPETVDPLLGTRLGGADLAYAGPPAFGDGTVRSAPAGPPADPVDDSADAPVYDAPGQPVFGSDRVRGAAAVPGPGPAHPYPAEGAAAGGADLRGAHGLDEAEFGGDTLPAPPERGPSGAPPVADGPPRHGPQAGGGRGQPSPGYRPAAARDPGGPVARAPGGTDDPHPTRAPDQESADGGEPPA